MGQLERYGLYVLVLVIFLILGVAIWGNDPRAAVKPLHVESEQQQPVDDDSLIDSLEDASLSRALDGRFEVAGFEKGLIDFGEEELTDITNKDIGQEFVPAEKEEPVKKAPNPEPKPVVEDDPALAVREYTIRKGDNLSSISQRMLGSAKESEWRRILTLNPDLNPNNLPLGRVIKIPPHRSVLANLKAKKQAIAKGARTHVVQKNENPSTIAQKYLGSQKYAKAIMAANNITDARKMRPGTTIVIPVVEKD